MIRLPIRTLLPGGLRTWGPRLQQRSSVCSVCMALSKAHQEQQLQEQERRQQQAYAQPRRRLQLATPLDQCIFPDYNPNYVRRRREDFDIRKWWLSKWVNIARPCCGGLWLVGFVGWKLQKKGLSEWLFVTVTTDFEINQQTNGDN